MAVPPGFPASAVGEGSTDMAATTTAALMSESTNALRMNRVLACLIVTKSPFVSPYPELSASRVPIRGAIP